MVLSLIDRIEAAADKDYGKVTFVSGDDHDTISWSALHADARAAAARASSRRDQAG
ncbi:MAG: hypothetical protein V9F03_12660 [Microthrixaceae bacterium]